MCQVSHVTYHVSHVTCRNIYIYNNIYKDNNVQSGKASWWRVCYQRGRPRLVFGWSWAEVSVFASLVFGQASMDGCDRSVKVSYLQLKLFKEHPPIGNVKPFCNPPLYMAKYF